MKIKEAVLPFLLVGLLIILYSCSGETGKTETYIGTQFSDTLKMMKERKKGNSRRYHNREGIDV